MISYVIFINASVSQGVHTHPHPSHPHISQLQWNSNTASRSWSDLMIKINRMLVTNLHFILLSNVYIIKKNPLKITRVFLWRWRRNLALARLCMSGYSAPGCSIEIVTFVELPQWEGDCTKIFFILKPLPQNQTTIKCLWHWPTCEALWDMYCYSNPVLLLFLFHFNCIVSCAKLLKHLSS